jgi:hypothetical protein
LNIEAEHSSERLPTNLAKALHGVTKQEHPWRMVSSGLLRRVALVRTDVSEEPGASFIRVRRNMSSQRTAVASCSLCCS